MKNFEAKFRCSNLEAAALAALNLGAVEREVMRQHDLFFTSPYARLKLRRFPDQPARPAELISYHRPNLKDPRVSEYFITPVTEPEALIVTLTHALGRPRSLAKTRRLFVFKATRIHLDAVETLGTFVELETVLGAQPEEEARQELNSLIRGLDLADPISAAYVDLLP